MSKTTTQEHQWFDALVRNNGANVALSDVDIFEAIRRDARTVLQSVEPPRRKQEAWRYSDLGRLYQQEFVTATSSARDLRFDDWIYPERDSYRLVLLNGRLVGELSKLPQQDDGLIIRAIAELDADDLQLVRDRLASQDNYTNDIFDTISRSLMQDGVFIRLGRGRVLDKPLEIVHLNQVHDSQPLAQPRSLVLLEESASMTLTERFVGEGTDSYFYNGLMRMELAANARLTHTRLQQESSASHHLSRVMVSQQRDSHYRLMHIATGAAWGRSDIHIRLEGPQAEAMMHGLYTVGARQYNDLHVDVHHLAPHGNSRQQFKGLLPGAGRGVFDGRILVDKEAQQTDAQLSNHNLLLSEQAEIDTKPLLEIYADDVKCSHGATVGSIDPQQLYYCRSRGLNRQQAIKLLCEGFAHQVIAEIEDPSLREHIWEHVSAVLEQQEYDL